MNVQNVMEMDYSYLSDVRIDEDTGHSIDDNDFEKYANSFL